MVPRLRPIEMSCIICGASFMKKPSEAAKAKYCSSDCRKIGVAAGQVRPIADRFWEKVDRSPDRKICWPWTGALDGRGYGNIGLGSDRWIRAHRLSYEMHHGEISDGQVIRHKCDNKRCVNPDHLEIGTQGDNLKDSYARSDREGFAKTIPEETVMGILQAKGLQRDIAAQFGVSRSYVGFIKAGQRRAKLTAAKSS